MLPLWILSTGVTHTVINSCQQLFIAIFEELHNLRFLLTRKGLVTTELLLTLFSSLETHMNGLNSMRIYFNFSLYMPIEQAMQIMNINLDTFYSSGLHH